MIELLIIVVVVLVIGFAGIRIVRPTEKALLERFGKYKKTLTQGFNWIIPIVDKMYKVDITENMVDVPEQFVITKDDLNAKVDAVVYFKVDNPAKAIYNAEDYIRQITSLARTTLRGIIGKMSLSDANSKRDDINNQLEKALDLETDVWGINIVRTEIQEITPPRDVAASMNQVVIAEREKIAAVNTANALETKADGERRAAIKEAEGSRKANILDAEGIKQAEILKAEGQRKSKELIAEGEAKAIKLVNESAAKYFKGSAVELEKLKTTQIALKDSTKFVIDPNSNVTNVIGDLSGVKAIPIGKK